MSTETNFEERWPELFANLTPAQHEQAVAACWYVLNDGFQLERESVERITTLLVDDPQQFAVLYGSYTEADDTRYAELADRAERGELHVKPGTERHGDEAAAEVRRLLVDADDGRTDREHPLTAVERGVNEHMVFADAALALAGHEVTDAELRNVIERAARHELTGDEAVAEIRRHVQGDLG